MLKNYFRLYIRSIKRNKFVSFITIFGLAVGLALVFLITLYIQFETTYDAYNSNADRIYRVTNYDNRLNWKSSGTSYLLAPILQNEYPEVEQVARSRGMLVEIEFDGVLEQNYFNCVDPSILDILTLEFVEGSRENALVEPYDILLSEKRAAKHFPNENPIGKVLTAELFGESIDFTVKGVLKNIPSNTTFNIPFLVNIELAKKVAQYIFTRYGAGTYEEKWVHEYYQTYILLKEGTDIDSFIDKINLIPDKYHDDYVDKSYDLQPIKEIYLYSDDFAVNYTRSGNLNQIYLYSSIAFLILIIACINFIILTTAQSLNRAKEIAVRKIIGADRRSLLNQVLLESVFTSFIAGFIAIGLTYLFRSTISQYLDVPLELSFSTNYLYPFSLFIITLSVGLLSGSYLAFYISGFDPLRIIKNSRSRTNTKSPFRRLIICLQMIIFIGLLSSSIIIYKQNHYFMNADLGFNKDHLLVMNLTSGDFSDHYYSFVAELKKNPNILKVTGGFGLPPDNSSAIIQEALFDDPTAEISVEHYTVDFNFFDTYDIDIINGRSFSIEFPTDTLYSMILNETAVRALHINEPIGKTIREKTIIGVVKDFHFHSLYHKIEPMIFNWGKPILFTEIGIRISEHNVKETLEYIESTWNNYNVDIDAPFEFSFIDDSIDQMYSRTKKFGRIINYSTFLAIFIASLGLFGMTMFVTKQKTQEISIRKVFGASTFRVLQQLSREIIWINIISTLLSIPIVLYLMNKWLMSFPYQTEISFWIFIVAGLGGLFISLTTMSFFSIKAALTNPAKTLKYE